MAPATDPYQEILDRLDLKHATRKIQPNDLLPSRPEDKVAGELGKRFSEHLLRIIQKGLYDPLPAYSVAVPKSRLTTRPATLLSLSDRVVYEAIVDALRLRIERYLLGHGIVFWPRGTECPKQWDEFQGSVMSPDIRHVARADIAGFYESIDHDRLGDAIVGATGFRHLAEAVTSFLERTMGSTRGLPQGLTSSDALATLYLAELDFVMIRHGFRYVRHGDDVRVGVRDYDEGCSAIRTLEATLRRLDLLLNVEKTRILRADTYAKALESRTSMIDAAKESIVSDKVRSLRDSKDALLATIDAAGMEQLGWDLFYHGRVDLEDAIEVLRPSLQPSEIELAEKLFTEAIARQPGEHRAFPKELFHQCLVWSLLRLSAGRSDAALGEVAGLMETFPEKGELFCSYLSALAAKPAARSAVARQVEIALGAGTVEWLTACLVRVLRRVPLHVSQSTLTSLKGTLVNPHNHWLATVEVAKLMADLEQLDRETLLRIWNSCPTVLRSDLVEAASQRARSAHWAAAFVDSARSDPIHEVVIRHHSQEN